MIQVLRETTGCKELRLGFNNVTSEHEYEHEYYQAYGIYGIQIHNFDMIPMFRTYMT